MRLLRSCRCGGLFSYQLPRYHDGVLRGETEVIGREPEPAGFGFITVGRDGADGDPILPGLADVVRRIELAGAYIDGPESESVLDGFQAGVFFEFHPGGKGVSMKYRRLNEPERRHGRTFPVARKAKQRGKVPLDAHFRFL